MKPISIPKLRSCERCGRPVVPRETVSCHGVIYRETPSSLRRRRFCSVFCARAHQQINTCGEVRTCQNCSKQFSRYRTISCRGASRIEPIARWEKRRFCSQSCGLAGGRSTRQKKKAKREAKVKRRCLQCNKSLVRRITPAQEEPLHLFKIRKYCNYQCSGASKRVKTTINRRHNTVIARRSILQAGRCHDACERCGATKLQSIIDIHHKNQNWQDNRPSNLIVLCRRCHTAAHLDIERKKKMKLPTICAIQKCRRKRASLKKELCKNHDQTMQVWGHPLVKFSTGKNPQQISGPPVYYLKNARVLFTANRSLFRRKYGCLLKRRRGR